MITKMMKSIKKLYTNNLEFLIRLWHFSKAYILFNFISGLFRAIHPIANVYIQGYLLNAVIYNSAPFIYMVLIILIFNLISFFIFALFETWVVEKFNVLETQKIRRDFNILMLNKVKELDIENYENPKFYDDYVRALTEVDTRIFEVYGIFQNIVISIISISVLATAIASMEPVYILFSVILVLNSFFVVSKNNKIHYNWTMSRTSADRRHGYIAEVFYFHNYAKEMKTYSLYKYFINKYRGIVDEVIAIQRTFSSKIFKNLILYKVIEPQVYGVALLMLLYGVYTQNILVGSFYIIFNSIFMFSGRMTDLVTALPQLNQTSLYIDNFHKVLNKKPKIIENNDGLDFSDATVEKINANNLKFEYTDSNGFYALSNVTLQINKGQKVAIVGENGSGKSTFVKLLLYLYQPSEGNICFNDIPYNEIVTKTIRSKFGTVFQDFQIYAISIAENILMREMTAEDEALIWDALEFSGLSGKIKQYEKNIYTNVTRTFDEEGIFLSGGENQKLAIARAYAQKSEILVFDEPSSALDPLAEHQFFNKVLELGSDKTVIYISHRLSTTVDADYIYLFDNGQIRESGTHSDLMAQKGHYCEMFTVQAEKYITED